MAQSKRWTVIEHGEGIEAVGTMAEASGIARARVLDLLRAAGERAATALNFSQSPLLITGNTIRAVDFAGLMKIGPGLEVEVVPKFLGGAVAAWREDFFFLAMLSRHGRLLASDRLRALSSTSGDLATLIGRALSQMYWDHHRQPIRTYRRKADFDFAIDGDFDSEDLQMPDTDGYAQTIVRYDRENEFNSVIKAAAQQLIPLVRDLETRAMLERIAFLLGPQTALTRSHGKRLPSRSRRWQSTFDLALDILKGFGLTYKLGNSLAPGFLLDTWRVWEDLLTISLRSSLGSHATRQQQNFKLGVRSRYVSSVWTIDKEVSVRPDVTVDGSGHGFEHVLVDAKYKGRADRGQQRISEADIYEAFAFSTASNIARVILVYPKVASQPISPLGTTSVLERIVIEGREIIALEAEVRGIARHSGLRQFADGLVMGIKSVTS